MAGQRILEGVAGGVVSLGDVAGDAGHRREHDGEVERGQMAVQVHGAGHLKENGALPLLMRDAFQHRVLRGG